MVKLKLPIKKQKRDLEKMNKVIPVFFSSDDNYIPCLAVSIKSLVNSSSSSNQYNIHILNSGLKEENKEVLKKFEKENVKIYFNDISTKINSIKQKLKEQTRDYYTESIFYRLFIPSLFTQYKKALYLDCDITIVKDVAELFNTNLIGNWLGAVVDEVVTSNEVFCDYVENALGIKRTKYFNSGVLVMNLESFRKNNIEQKFLELLQNFNFGTVAPDQDYLNVICKNKVFYISKAWNKMPVKNTNFNTKDLKLIHYNMFEKPWKYSNVLYEEYFWETAKQTDFYNNLLTCKNNYTEEQKKNDVNKALSLLEYCKEIIASPTNFRRLMEKKFIKDYKKIFNLDTDCYFNITLDKNDNHAFNLR